MELRLIKHRLQISAELMLDYRANPPQWLIDLAANHGVVTYDYSMAGIEIIDPPGVTW